VLRSLSLFLSLSLFFSFSRAFSEPKDLLLNFQPGRGTASQVDSPQTRTPTPLGWDEDALSPRTSCRQFCENRHGQGEVETSAQLVWAFPHFSILWAMYMPLPQNVVGDFLSHQNPPSGEWRLHPDVVETIWS